MNEALLEAVKGLNREKEILTIALSMKYTPTLASRLNEIDSTISKLLQDNFYRGASAKTPSDKITEEMLMAAKNFDPKTVI